MTMPSTQVLMRMCYLAIGLLALGTGCAGRPPVAMPSVPPPASGDAFELQNAERAAAYQENSLYTANSGLNGLFQDTKARRAGDIVTVKIEESSKATNKANTKTARDSSLTAGIDTFMGVENWWQDKVLRWLGSDMPKINPFGSASVKGSMQSDFEGDGSTTRSGDLTAYITCRVTEVMPNGNLRIVGTREVMVNHENQVIILSGTIRPRDIASDNIIRSIFVSDAKIAYSGSGVIDDRQRPGWMANFLETVWPF
ncbi:MAG: flagellar basal body L-ring protein FlgH [Hyphomicrobiales bacterium]